MRLLFAGSPEIACPALAALVELQLTGGACEVAAVLTNPDTPKGRGKRSESRELSPTAVSDAASCLSARLAGAGLRPPLLFKFERIGKAETDAVKAAGTFDLLVSFAYGAIFPAEFIKQFRLGGINVHPSLLPKYRGAAPIEAAIQNGETETGITIQVLADRMDSGCILAREKIALAGNETGGSLSQTVAKKAASMLASLIADFKNVKPYPQNENEATYCGKTNHENRRIDWTRSAREIDAQIRAHSPGARCWTTHNGLELSILEGRVVSDILSTAPANKPPSGAPEGTVPGGAPEGTVLGADKQRGILIQCGKGIFAARVLQYQTKKALDFRAFLNGAKNFTGAVLT